MRKGFISYSHADRAICKDLRMQLRALERAKMVDFWNDTRLRAGDKFHPEIIRSLSSADLILLLVSPDFVNSEYIWEHEVPGAEERAAAGATVIPIILRPCTWQILPFSSSIVLPPGGRPVSSYEDKDLGHFDVAQGIVQCLGSPNA